MREWLETYLAGAMAVAKPLGFSHYLRPLWQIIKRGNVAMQWLEQHEQGASIAAIMRQSVIAMREAERSYAQHAQYREAPPGTDQATSSNRI